MPKCRKSGDVARAACRPYVLSLCLPMRTHGAPLLLGLWQCAAGQTKARHNSRRSGRVLTKTLLWVSQAYVGFHDAVVKQRGADQCLPSAEHHVAPSLQPPSAPVAPMALNRQSTEVSSSVTPTPPALPRTRLFEVLLTVTLPGQRDAWDTLHREAITDLPVVGHQS